MQQGALRPRHARPPPRRRPGRAAATPGRWPRSTRDATAPPSRRPGAAATMIASGVVESGALPSTMIRAAAVEDALPVQRIDQNLAAPRAPGGKAPPSASRTRWRCSNFCSSVPSGGIRWFIRPGIRGFLGMQRAAEGDVELLEPPADAEDRHPPRHARADQRQGHRVAIRIEAATLLGRLVAVEARMHVGPPAGEDEAVTGRDQVADRAHDRQRRHHQRDGAGQRGHRLDIGDPDRLHRILVVDAVRVADDADDGLGHAGRRGAAGPGWMTVLCSKDTASRAARRAPQNRPTTRSANPPQAATAKTNASTTG